MALKISLKPGERLILGGAVLTNGKTKADLIVENKVAILREKDILKEENADSPCRKIYFVVQLMYVGQGDIVEYHNLYWQLVRDVIKAAPSTIEIIDKMSDKILHTNYYQALKLAKRLIDYEQEVINNVR